MLRPNRGLPVHSASGRGGGSVASITPCGGAARAPDERRWRCGGGSF